MCRLRIEIAHRMEWVATNKPQEATHRSYPRQHRKINLGVIFDSSNGVAVTTSSAELHRFSTLVMSQKKTVARCMTLNRWQPSCSIHRSLRTMTAVSKAFSFSVHYNVNGNLLFTHRQRRSRRWKHSIRSVSASKRSDGEVNETLKRQNLFSTIAPLYDQMNDVMSLGQHRDWKRLCVQYSGCRKGSSALDLCCGSGDVTELLSEKVGPHGRVIGLDFSAEMLKEAKERNSPSIKWVQGDAEQLPFDDGQFDAVTISYGLRNVTNIPQALSEIYRVLRPGGKFAALDFNNSSYFFVDQFQAMVLKLVVVPVASAFGMGNEYYYLRSSIHSFPPGTKQERLAYEAGFSQSRHYVIASGLMGILVGGKS